MIYANCSFVMMLTTVMMMSLMSMAVDTVKRIDHRMGSVVVLVDMVVVKVVVGSRIFLSLDFYKRLGLLCLDRLDLMRIHRRIIRK